MTDNGVSEMRNGESIPKDERAVPQSGRALWWARRLWPLPIFAASLAVAWTFVGSDPERVFAKAQSEARAGRYDRAAITVKKLGRLRAPTPADHLLKAQIAGGVAEFDRAVTELAGIPDDHPLGQLARLSQGQIEARRGRLRSAEDAFLKTLTHWPDCVQARRELVYIYSVQRRLSRLDEQLSSLAELGALDKAHVLHWGRVRHVPWSPAVDLPALERYVAADPEDRPSRLSLADALTRLNHLDEAEAVLKVFPASDIDALVIRVRLAEARGNPDAINALLAQGPEDHPELSLMRAQRALLLRDGPTAVRNFKIAMVHDPHDRATLFGLATALTMTGRPEESRHLREEVRLFDQLGVLLSKVDANAGGDDPSLARRLGLACAELGRPAEARVWLGQAIARDPLDRDAHQALYRLEHPPETASSSGFRHAEAR